MRRMIFLLVLGLTGCQTAEQVHAERQARLQSVVGMSLADFNARVGLPVVQVYDTAPRHRTFVILGRTVTIGLVGSYGVPSIARTETCFISLAAVATSSENSPASWRIQSVSSRGPCADTY